MTKIPYGSPGDIPPVEVKCKADEFENYIREYTGGLDGSGCLYKDCHTIQLVLEGEVISEEYLS